MKRGYSRSRANLNGGELDCENTSGTHKGSHKEGVLLCGWFVLTIDINYLQEMQNIWPHINELTELKSGAFCGQPGKHISNI